MKQIAPILREMKINSFTDYPIHRYASIAGTIQRLKHEGFKFKMRISDKKLVVTRLR